MKRVLVVDDFSSIRSLVRAVLNDCGSCLIEEAGDGLAALTILRSHPFDLVISDWNMPKMSGLEFLKAIRADESLASTPVVMLTAETTMDNIHEAVKLGIHGYIKKPFSPEKLAAAIKKFL